MQSYIFLFFFNDIQVCEHSVVFFMSALFSLSSTEVKNKDVGGETELDSDLQL